MESCNPRNWPVKEDVDLKGSRIGTVRLGSGGVSITERAHSAVQRTNFPSQMMLQEVRIGRSSFCPTEGAAHETVARKANATKNTVVVVDFMLEFFLDWLNKPTDTFAWGKPTYILTDL